MTETLEVSGSLDAPARVVAPSRPPVRRAGSPPRVSKSGIVASARAALEHRRLFVLMPFAAVAGIVGYADLPMDPPPIILAGTAVVIAAAIIGLFRWIDALRVAVVIAAFWSGYCLLPIHGAMFGTSMLSRPVYGDYRARVDEIIEATADEQRVVLSQITPTGSDREIAVRRARVLIKGTAALSPADIVAGSFRFADVPGPVFPGGYDTQFQSYFDGIGA
jgi:competence protein ComEC